MNIKLVQINIMTIFSSSLLIFIYYYFRIRLD